MIPFGLLSPVFSILLQLQNLFQPVVHYSLHFLFPGLIAWMFYRSDWKKAWFVLICTMAVDLDHLISTPIFDPLRCSIGHHMLHSEIAISVYFVLLFFQKSRLVAIGLLFHMLTDFQDCLWR